ncbi:SPOR domain-containing protein [Fulvivirgaceae bacterium PWU37]|uniref:SPOR domain-containing protein n=2 Tax=Dawidia soli TaxID=2782352 RepID=A0AAP2DC45_9BACT|nr:SPOR domain-containing protein [Dawidia soli]
MHLSKGMIYTSCILLLAGCKTTQKTTSSTSQDSKYTEDLSVWRPKAEPATATSVTTPTTTGTTPEDRKTQPYTEARFAINRQLDTVLDSIDQTNRSRRYIDGFTIQVYSGRREEALNAKKQLATSLPRLESEVQFTEPIFRVKVGKYYSRMEAQQDYTAVKRYFPAAILIPEKISLNE